MSQKGDKRVRDLADTVQFPVRIKEAVRVEIERAARQRRVTLNAEAAARLEQSFKSDADRFGGKHVSDFINLTAHLIRSVELGTGRKFTEDETTYAFVREGLGELIARYSPDASKEDWDERTAGVTMVIAAAFQQPKSGN